MTIRSKTLLRAALLLGAAAGLSGCVYDLGLGFASDGYYDDYDDGYGCDPYRGYDAYYDCDYGQGFGNIGFGGGWYDNYYYPGFGIFLFDNVGRRYPMREQYRRYWGEKRHNWYREHRSDRAGDGRYDRRPNRYNDGVTPGRTGWPDRQNGRAHDGDNDRREGKGDRRRGRDVPSHSGDGGRNGVVRPPNVDVIEGAGRGRDNANGPERRDRPRDSNPAMPPPRQAPMEQDAVAPRSAPPPQFTRPSRPERPEPARRPGRDERGAVQDE